MSFHVKQGHSHRAGVQVPVKHLRPALRAQVAVGNDGDVGVSSLDCLVEDLVVLYIVRVTTVLHQGPLSLAALLCVHGGMCISDDTVTCLIGMYSMQQRTFPVRGIHTRMQSAVPACAGLGHASLPTAT